MRMTLPFILGCLLTGATLPPAVHGDEACPQIFLRPDVQAKAAAIADEMTNPKSHWTSSDDMKLYFTNRLAGQRYSGELRDDIYRAAGGERGNDKLSICFPKFRNALMPIEQKEKTDSENQALEQQKQALEQQKIEAERNKPINVLLRSYADYIYVKKCYDERKGYLLVNVSDEELQRAKTAVRNIEQNMIEADSALNKNALWEEANKVNSSFGTERDRCQYIIQRLETTYKNLSPDAKSIRKDF
jgi:hypothetical protein